jgi:hypothetical protein
VALKARYENIAIVKGLVGTAGHFKPLGCIDDPVVAGVNVKESIQTVKFGINYRFRQQIGDAGIWNSAPECNGPVITSERGDARALSSLTMGS